MDCEVVKEMIFVILNDFCLGIYSYKVWFEEVFWDFKSKFLELV